MTLADFTGANLIVPDLRVREVAAVIRELSRTLHQQQRVPDALQLCQAALERERLVSTALACGMALPHARLPGLNQVSFALGRCYPPLSWGVPGGRPVCFIFLLAVPQADLAHYLSVISGLARLGKETRLLKALGQAPDASRMLATLEEVPLPGTDSPGSSGRAGEGWR